MTEDRHSSSDETQEIPDSCPEMPSSNPDAPARNAVPPAPSEPHAIGTCVQSDTPELGPANIRYSSEPSADPSLALIGTAATPSPSPSPILEFCFPSFGEFSPDFNERFLMDYFCNTLSHLIVLREDEGNPFQQLVLPLAYESQAIKCAIYALASAHLVGKGMDRRENSENSIRFHNEAIRNLAKLIELGHGVDRNELLATIMLIVYYEVLVQRRRSNLVEGHLKGAKAIMQNSPSRKNRTSNFLEQAFRFYDVIAALSSGTAPLSNDPICKNLEKSSLRRSQQHVSRVGGVDALLGLATSLWPVIQKLSGLLTLKNDLEASVAHGDVSGATVTQAKFDAECAAVEFLLEEWQPVMPTECPSYSDFEKLSSSAKGKMKGFQSIFNNALAYRHSALVYLYRTIYNAPRNHPVVQHHASVSLVHCKDTVLHEGPMGALLWPLFVASCEAVDPMDRQSARDTFQGITRRQGMANIDRAWEVVQEVWNRAGEVDASDAQMPNGIMAVGKKDLWRRVSEDMGVTIVFG